MNSTNFKISVIDKFLIISLHQDNKMFPEGAMLHKVKTILESYSSDYQILCDYRKVEFLTNDLVDFIVEMLNIGAKLLVKKELIEQIEEKNINLPNSIFPVNSESIPYEYTQIDDFLFKDHDHFLMSITENYDSKLDSYKQYTEPTPPTLAEFKIIAQIDAYISELGYDEYLNHCTSSKGNISGLGIENVYAIRYLRYIINKISKNSLLTEFTFRFDKNDVNIVPYHSHSIYNIDANDNLIIGKPGVFASKTNSIFSNDLKILEEILRNNGPENQIQKFLMDHPEFLYSLGYKKIFPQVILERNDGSKLIPDFILQPIGDEWCDILDIKLPDIKSVITGTKDRKKFSYALSDLSAQLREYSAYFEDEKYAKRIEEKFGIKCYKPKLIGVIGETPDYSDERQIRRVMTQYSDLGILTFDKLIEISKDRVLI